MPGLYLDGGDYLPDGYQPKFGERHLGCCPGSLEGYPPQYPLVMKSHSNHNIHHDFETREFRHRERRRQRDDYDRREGKRINYEEEEGRDETREFKAPPDVTPPDTL